MSDDDLDGGFWRNLSGLARDWVTTKRRDLRHGQPQTFAQSGGSVGTYEWGDQSISQSELKQVKQVRETGGLAAQLFHAKALMRFGAGADLTAENDALQSELRDLLPGIDDLALALGEDATFYPYGLGELVETNGGSFSHIEPVEPWTTLPETDDHGDITAWLHHVDRDHELRLTPDDIGHIAINRASGRDTVGISDVLRAEEEIEQYKANQQAINNAIEVAGFPHHVWKVGAEGGTPVSDDELRRYRTLVEGMAGDTQFIVGPDVEHSKITPADFNFADITERDLRLLTGAIGLPFEIVGYGSDGLGSGHEADLKMNLLRIQNEAARRRFADQFRREFLKPIVERYTAFDADEEEYGIHFEPFLDDKSEMAEWIQTVGDYMRNEDVTERLDLPPIEDEEIATSYRTPKEIEEAEEGPDEGGFGGGGGPGLFSDGRALQGVPDNANPISDASECQNGSVVTGPRGGLYCVPSGDDGGGDDGGADSAQASISNKSEFSSQPPEEVRIDDVVDETNLTESGLPDGNTKQDIDILEREDGSTVFVKDFEQIDRIVEEGGWAGTDEDDRLNTSMGSAVTKELGGNSTTNWYDAEDKVMLSEGVDNIAGGIDEADVDDEALVDTVAAGVLSGNNDLHSQQFVVDEDGQPYLIDHDHAGKQLEGGKTLRKAFGFKGPMTFSDNEPEDVWNRMQEMVEEQDIDGMAAGLEEQGMDEHAENLRANAEFVSTTDFEELDL